MFQSLNKSRNPEGKDKPCICLLRLSSISRYLLSRHFLIALIVILLGGSWIYSGQWILDRHACFSFRQEHLVVSTKLSILSAMVTGRTANGEVSLKSSYGLEGWWHVGPMNKFVIIPPRVNPVGCYIGWSWPKLICSLKEDKVSKRCFSAGLGRA